MIEPLCVVAGRQVFPSELPLIASIVARYSCDGLRRMAEVLCEQWSWERRGSPNVLGAQRILSSLAYRGLVEVPGIEAARRPSTQQLEAITTEIVPLSGKLSDFARVCLRLVEAEETEHLFDSLIAQHHYLGGRRVIGAHLKYLAFIDKQPVAALLWGRAALKIGCRDRFVGWSVDERRQGINRIANNYRFLILPWVRIRYLASHVLSMTTRVIAADWEGSFVSGWLTWRPLSTRTDSGPRLIWPRTGWLWVTPKGPGDVAPGTISMAIASSYWCIRCGVMACRHSPQKEQALLTRDG